MTANEFDQLSSILGSDGIESALESLIEMLRTKKKYHELFEALKIQLRHQLGLPLWYQEPATGDDTSRVPDLEQQLEKGLLDACEQVGNGLLDEGRIREAWMYLRPVGNKAAVAEKIRRLNVDEDQMDELIEVTVHEGVDPPTGFARLLDKYGVCNAITTFDAQSPAMDATTRRTVAGMLVRFIYRELVENVRAHIERESKPKAESMPSTMNLGQLCAGRGWLTADGSYHIDTSHLSSVVRCGRLIDDCDEIRMARELAEYGSTLDANLQYPGDEPFTDNFLAHRHYFDALLNTHSAESLQYFRQRAQTVDAYQEGTLAAEVYIELLARTGRTSEAIDASLEMLPPGTHTRGVAPTLLELCRQAGDFTKLQQLCRERDDLLGFATSLLYGARANDNSSVQ